MIGLRGQLWRLSWIAALVLGFSVWGSDALAHTGRVNSFSISPTSNLTPGQRINFSGSVYGWHCGHSYTAEARIYRGRSVSGSFVYRRSGLSYRNVCGSSSSSGQTYSISGSLTAASTPGTNYFILRTCSQGFSGGCADRVVSYTVRQPNRRPTITNPGNKTVNEGQRLSFTVSATDPDSGHANALTWTISGRPSGASFSGRGTRGTFTWTPTFTQSGSYRVTFTVRDPNGLTASTAITITVRNVNRAPSITSNPPTSATEDVLYAYNPRGTDPDSGDRLTWSLTTRPSGATINATNGQIRWTPGDTHAGKSFAFVLRLCDQSNACATQSWNVSVRNVNDPPRITGTPGTSATEDQLYTFSPGVSDPDPGDSHTWKIKKAPPGATIASNGRVSWTPGDADAGKTYDFEIEVCDKAGSCATLKWRVTVKNVNDPPKISSVAPTVAIEKQLYNYKAKVTDPDPGDSHTWTLEQGPPGATIDRNTGEIKWTPGVNDANKTFIFQIKVCDKANTCAVQRWTVKVTNVNDPPKIVGTPPTSATEDKEYSYTFRVTDPDPGDSHVWSLAKGPQGAKVDPKTGMVTWTPGDADAGKTFDFEIEVCDKANACVTYKWKVTVINVNDPPSVTGTPPTTAQEDKAYTYSPGVNDPDPGDTHTWTLEKAPKGATIDPKTGKITWTPKDSDAEKTFDFTVKVCDKAKVCATQSWQVKVENVNDPPTMKGTPPTTATEDKLYTYKPSATDPDPGDVLTWSIKKAPAGATIDKNTGEVKWTPGDADAGKTYDFEIEVCDAQGACAKQTWKVTVTNVNDPPVLTGTPPKEAFVGEAMTYEPKVTDPDAGDSHTWTLKKGPSSATIDPKTGKISWTPAPSDAGTTVTFTVEVCDNGTPKACVSQTFSVGVEQRCKVDVDCPSPNICVKGLCAKPGCASKSPKCTTSGFCKDGSCIPDKCLTTTCQQGTFCRPSDGKCIQPCAGLTCQQGEFCKDGTCIKDPCAANPCAADQVCDSSDPKNPTCKKNPCGAQSCRHARVCSEGKCIDDPCVGIQCPSAAARCVAGQCIDRKKCGVDIDCDGDEVCLGGKCYPPGCYTKKNLCSGNELCLSASCKNDPCASVSCKTGEYCRRSDGTCIAPCAGVNCKTSEICRNGVCQADPCSKVQCSAGEVCIQGECKKKNCTGASVCKHGRICNELTNTCTDDPCDNVKCPDSRQVCKFGQCLAPPSCTYDKDCPGQQLCVGGKCIAPTCSSSADCQQGELCVNGKCSPDPCAAVSCNAGEVCKAGQCKPSCAGVFCQNDERCVDGKCVSDPCAGKQCPSGERCENGSCVKDPCEADSCKRGRQCKTDKCEPDPCASLKCPAGQSCKDGECAGDKTCKSDKDCPGDSICQNGKCQPPGCYTQTCAQGSICVNGQCRPDSCSVTTCGKDEVCRPVDGKCVKLCRCPDGERCNPDGQCESDPCAGKNCSNGETCKEGQCVPDECSKQGPDACKHNRKCEEGACKEDPCKNLQCPDGLQCKDGVCFGPPAPPEPGPEAGPEPGPEPAPEAGPEPTPEPAQDLAPERRALSLTGGCGCNSQAGTLFPLALFFLSLLALIAIRRR